MKAVTLLTLRGKLGGVAFQIRPSGQSVSLLSSPYSVSGLARTLPQDVVNNRYSMCWVRFHLMIAGEADYWQQYADDMVLPVWQWTVHQYPLTAVLGYFRLGYDALGDEIV